MEGIRVRYLSPQDVHDLLRGSTVLGSGGGGRLSAFKTMVDTIIEAERSVRLVSIDEAPSDARICTAYGMSPVTTVDDPLSIRHNSDEENISEQPVVKAFRLVKESVGRISGIFPAEIGAANVVVALYVACKTDDLFLLDADPVGRSVPEMSHAFCRMDRAGLPSAPVVIINRFGERFFLENVANSARLESTLRALSVVGGGTICGAGHVFPVHKLRAHLIPNTMSRALEIGRNIRNAMTKNIDVAEVVAQKHGGKVVFRGIVHEFIFKTEGGFTVGYVEVHGVNEWDGQKCKIEAKNENMGLWVDGEVKATVPDIISVFNEQGGEAVINPSYRIGMGVAIAALPAAEPLITNDSLSTFGPAHVGVTRPFKSILHK